MKGEQNMVYITTRGGTTVALRWSAYGRNDKHIRKQRNIYSSD